jgi:Sulfotransferase family
MTPTPAVRVVFIAGYARCGSTLLERMLGQLDGFDSFGELRHIWFRSFQDNQLCGCGLPFHECPFWGKIADRAFGGFDGVDAEAIWRNKRWVDNPVNTPRILTGGWTQAFRSRLAAYVEPLRALYSAIQEVSGAAYLVDSSKDPQHAYILRSIPGFEVQMVHLIRDSRAVAYSWRRVRRRPEIHWEARDMPRYPAARTAVAWSLTNLAAEAAQRVKLPYVRVRYEDLVENPRAQLARIVDKLSLGQPSLDFLSDGKVALQTAHTVSGNPMRFAAGEVVLSPDFEWKHGMRRADRRLVTALTLPQLKRYGYPLHPSPFAAGPSAVSS